MKYIFSAWLHAQSAAVGIKYKDFCESPPNEVDRARRTARPVQGGELVRWRKEHEHEVKRNKVRKDNESF